MFTFLLPNVLARNQYVHEHISNSLVMRNNSMPRHHNVKLLHVIQAICVANPTREALIKGC